MGDTRLPHPGPDASPAERRAWRGVRVSLVGWVRVAKGGAYRLTEAALARPGLGREGAGRAREASGPGRVALQTPRHAAVTGARANARGLGSLRPVEFMVLGLGAGAVFGPHARGRPRATLAAEADRHAVAADQGSRHGLGKERAAAGAVSLGVRWAKCLGP
jgi:hypothetical protein